MFNSGVLSVRCQLFYLDATLHDLHQARGNLEVQRHVAHVIGPTVVVLHRLVQADTQAAVSESARPSSTESEKRARDLLRKTGQLTPSEVLHVLEATPVQLTDIRPTRPDLGPQGPRSARPEQGPASRLARRATKKQLYFGSPRRPAGRSCGDRESCTEP